MHENGALFPLLNYTLVCKLFRPLDTIACLDACMSALIKHTHFDSKCAVSSFVKFMLHCKSGKFSVGENFVEIVFDTSNFVA